jgi:DNA topoisomerase IA
MAGAVREHRRVSKLEVQPSPLDLVQVLQYCDGGFPLDAAKLVDTRQQLFVTDRAQHETASYMRETKLQTHDKARS